MPYMNPFEKLQYLFGVFGMIKMIPFISSRPMVNINKDRGIYLFTSHKDNGHISRACT